MRPPHEGGMMSATTTTTGRMLTVRRRYTTDDGERVVIASWYDEGGAGGLYSFGMGDGGTCSVRSPRDRYAVTCTPAGKAVACTCPDFRYKRKRRGEVCKHCEAVSALIRAGKFRV